jgi:sugar phosphate isomerase/epimerase
VVAAEGDVPLIGVCTGFGSAEKLKAGGAAYYEEGVGNLLMPAKPEAEFVAQLAKAKATGMMPYSCNGFLPGTMKAVGEKANHDELVKYATTAFERAKTAGMKIIVFGSGGARKIPEGFPREKAVAQMVELCKRLADAAGKNGITLAIEPLNSKECNYMVKLEEIVEVVTKVDNPGLAITADFYHMALGGDGAKECEAAAKWIKHCHIAEKDGRTAPGIKGDDFTPYFRVLKQNKYAGRISIEGKWTNMAAELPKAVETIRKQWISA